MGLPARDDWYRYLYLYLYLYGVQMRTQSGLIVILVLVSEKERAVERKSVRHISQPNIQQFHLTNLSQITDLEYSRIQQ